MSQHLKFNIIIWNSIQMGICKFGPNDLFAVNGVPEKKGKLSFGKK